MHRAWFRGLGAALMVAVLLVAGPAQAHDYLVGSTPEQGAMLDAPPTQVSLEFNTAIGQKFAQVAVVGPGGATFQQGDPVVDGAVVTQQVDAIPPGSAVTISYRVVSSDGHPIGGTVPFTVAAGTADAQQTPDTTTAATPTATPAQTASDDVAPAATSTGAEAGGGSLLPWMGLLFAAAATIAGVVTFAISRRRRSDAASDAARTT
jgi:methionine-rich copper-binding protein CopC